MIFQPELMRDILLAIEKHPAGELIEGAYVFEGIDQAVVNGHTKILIDEGYIDGKYVTHGGMPLHFVIFGLAMKAHDFLANARNNTVWKKVLAESKEKGMSVSVTILDKLLEKAAHKYLGLE